LLTQPLRQLARVGLRLQLSQAAIGLQFEQPRLFERHVHREQLRQIQRRIRVSQDHAALDHVFQLADVTRPLMRQQCADGACGKARHLLEMQGADAQETHDLDQLEPGADLMGLDRAARPDLARIGLLPGQYHIGQVPFVDAQRLQVAHLLQGLRQRRGAVPPGHRLQPFEVRGVPLRPRHVDRVDQLLTACAGNGPHHAGHDLVLDLRERGAGPVQQPKRRRDQDAAREQPLLGRLDEVIGVRRILQLQLQLQRDRQFLFSGAAGRWPSGWQWTAPRR
jgi:hypothetical protein